MPDLVAVANSNPGRCPSHFSRPPKDHLATDFRSNNALYGVSYIGGDPCGSKYNVDPFREETMDDNSFKPGLPDDMKERIEALAKEKIARANEEESTREKFG